MKSPLQISLLYAGRPRDPGANAMADEYAKRLGRFCEFRMKVVRGEPAFEPRARACRVVLDPRGRELDSAGFADLIARAEREATREIIFLVGGADGLPEAVRRQADLALALSRLTLPHELARVVLLEQIYRAFTMLRGHPYPR